MRTCTLSFTTILTHGTTYSVGFKLHFSGGTRPVPRPRHLSVEERDLVDWMDWVERKFDVQLWEYQPSMFTTWEWEATLENEMLDRNLRYQ